MQKHFYITISPILLVSVQFNTLIEYLLIQGFGRDKELYFNEKGNTWLPVLQEHGLERKADM